MTSLFLGAFLFLAPSARADERWDYQQDLVNGNSQEVCVEIKDTQEVLRTKMVELLYIQETKLKEKYPHPIEVFYMDWAMAAQHPGDDPAATLHPNAMTAGPGVPPNGDAAKAKIIVMQGMLDYVGKTQDYQLNDFEIKFILGHELGHLQLRHGERIRDCQRDRIAAKTEGKSDFDRWIEKKWPEVENLGTEATVNKFFKDVCKIELYKNELEADEYAMKLLGNAQAGSMVFERVRYHNPEASASDVSHPPIGERIRLMDERFQKSFAFKDEVLKGAARKKGKGPGCVGRKAGLDKADKGIKRLPGQIQ